MPTVKELRTEAESQGIEVPANAKKAEIQDLIDNQTGEDQGQVATTNTGHEDFEPNIEGYSYGTAPDRGTDPKPEEPDNQLNERSVQHDELTVEEQQDIEKQLSDGDISARVIQSLGDYVKVKFFKDNKPFAVYKSRSFTVADAQTYLKEQLDG